MFGVKRTEAERQRGLRGRRAIVALVLLGSCFLATSGAILWELRRQTWNNAARASENLVAALSQDIGRNVELYDLSLQAAIDGLRLPEINQVSPQTRQAALFDRAATAKYLGSTLVLNEHGDVMEEAGAVRTVWRTFLTDLTSPRIVTSPALGCSSASHSVVA